MIVLLLCVLIVAFIVLSAFFSSAEITYAKANRFRVEKAAGEGSRTARLELHIIDHYVRSLSAILVGNNLANIASSSAATMETVSPRTIITIRSIAMTATTSRFFRSFFLIQRFFFSLQYLVMKQRSHCGARA